MLILSNVEKFNTPAYVFSEIQLLESYKSLCSKMPEVCVYYTLKANAEIPILQSLEKYVQDLKWQVMENLKEH